MTTSVASTPRVPILGAAVVGQDADPERLDAAVHLGVVDDLAGEEDPAVRELLPRLVGVLHRAVDAVAEAELAGELHPHARPRAPCSRAP